jgi:hypothetical protein
MLRLAELLNLTPELLDLQLSVLPQLSVLKLNFAQLTLKLDVLSEQLIHSRLSESSAIRLISDPTLQLLDHRVGVDRVSWFHIILQIEPLTSSYHLNRVGSLPG